jgi:PAS domain S-box-containing protein
MAAAPVDGLPVNILMVDDQPENLVALEAILGDLGANLVRSTSGEEALRQLLTQDFAVILLDVQMPQMDGFELATLIRHRPRSQDTPIIFLTAFSSSEQFMFKGYALGAVDYLIKPIAPNILLSKVAIFIELFKKTEALRQKTEMLQRQTQVLQQQASQMEAINAELQISEERFRLLCTCSPLGVFVIDTEGQCTYANPRFQTICGDPPPGATEQSWLACVHPEEVTLARSTWTAYMADGQEYFQEFRLQTDGDTLRWISIRSARILSDQNHLLGYVGTVEDITERKQAEAASAQILREQLARQEAENANRMKDDFIAVLSHELRTPLNSILGWANLLQSRHLPPEKVEFAIGTIERNALAQKQLIEDIMDVSQIVRGKLQLHRQPLDLVGVAQAALETVAPSAEAKAIALTHNLHDHPRLEVIGDALRLQQVIWNLLTNAVKFTPNQGHIDLQVSVTTEAPPAPADPDAAAVSYAQLRVSDTGAGIDADFLPHIFDRFRQADSSSTRAQGGLGLGLAIVHYLVEQHQGHIWATSPGLNQGTTFTLALPLAAAPDPADPAPAPPDPAAPGNLLQATAPPPSQALAGIPLLIVEDDADARNFLTYLLGAQGALVSSATGGKEALHMLHSQRPAVLLCDISMPDMDGYALLRAVRSQLPEPQASVPAIAITAHARLSDQAEALANGFQHHLAKPIDPEVLIRTILQLAAQGQGDQPSGSSPAARS